MTYPLYTHNPNPASEIPQQLVRLLAKEIWEELETAQSTDGLKPCDLHLKYISRTCRHCKKLLRARQILMNPDAIVEEVQEQSKSTSKPKRKGPGQQKIDLMANSPFLMPSYDKHGRFISNVDSSIGSLHSVLRQNILSSTYWSEHLMIYVNEMDDLIQEISERCKHAEPWTMGAHNTPSTFFCCLQRLIMLNPTELDIRRMIHGRQPSSFVRMAGFLYVRYMSRPEHIWARLEGHLLDLTEVHPEIKARPEIISPGISMGEFISKLMDQNSFYGAFLPRLPVIIEREIKRLLPKYAKRRERKTLNSKNIAKFNRGTLCLAVSAANGHKWHQCEIKQKIQENSDFAKVYFFNSRSTLNANLSEQSEADTLVKIEEGSKFIQGLQLVDLGLLVRQQDLNDQEAGSKRRQRSRSAERADVKQTDTHYAKKPASVKSSVALGVPLNGARARAADKDYQPRNVVIVKNEHKEEIKAPSVVVPKGDSEKIKELKEIYGDYGAKKGH